MVGTAPAVNVQSNVGMAVPVAASRDESKKACPLISGSSSEAAWRVGSYTDVVSRLDARFRVGWMF